MEGSSTAVPCRFRLPVSGYDVALRHPTGAQDLLLLEAAADDTALALALAGHLARPFADVEIDWPTLTVTDLDVFILRLRQTVLGDRVRAEVTCQSSGCGQRIDIAFGITEYLDHCRPALPVVRGSWKVSADEEPGWFRLMAMPTKAKSEPASESVESKSDASNRSGTSSGGIAFRLPTAADQLAIAGEQNGADELARRCIRPAGISTRLRRRVEEAMETMAPSLSGELRGTCPECGTKVDVHFNAREFCLKELRGVAAFIYHDIDLLARRYHWSEKEILTMPQVRRTQYAELARQQSI